MRKQVKNRRRRRAPGGRLDRPPSVTGRGGFRPGVHARRYSACCEAESRVGVVGIGDHGGAGLPLA